MAELSGPNKLKLKGNISPSAIAQRQTGLLPTQKNEVSL